MSPSVLVSKESLGAFVPEQRLQAFNLLWRWPLLFHADENGARVVAEINTQPYELLRMRHVLDNENGPDADVDLVEVRGGDEGFDGRLIHVPLFAEARSIASNSVFLVSCSTISTAGR